MKQASWILIVCASVGAAGCGMKGPLYLPDKNASVVTRPGTGNTTTTPGQTAPGSSATPPAGPGATTSPAPGGTAAPSTPPKQPQDGTGDNSQSSGSTPKN
jgi:predicted small lipoprotein YifL